MNKHILREHRLKCTKFPEAFKEESKLTMHIPNAHSGVHTDQVMTRQSLDFILLLINFEIYIVLKSGLSFVCAFPPYLVRVVLHTACDEDEGVVHRREPSGEVGHPHPHVGQEYDCHIGGNTTLSQ